MTTPSAFGRYQIKDKLGRGGMAEVYLAYDPRFEREVALKLLPRELMYAPAIRARFEQEARTVAALDHPAIVPVYDFGEQDGQLYLVMRYMAGGSLGDRLQDGPLSLEETGRIVARIAPALDEAHQKGVIHRDIKPGNILFDHRDEPALADFGIVRLTESTAGLTGSGWVGTPAFMAPEMGDPGGVTPLVDIYALGVTVYMMLSGQHPYEADTPSAYIVAHVSKPVPNILALRPGLPPGTQVVIEQAMAKSPADRYQSAGALADGLREVGAQGLSPAPIGDETTLFEAPVELTTEEVALAPAAPDAQEAIPPDTPPSSPTIYEAAPPTPIPAYPTPIPHSGRRSFPLWVVGVGLVIVVGLMVLLGMASALWPRGDEIPEEMVADSLTDVQGFTALPQEPTPTVIPTPMAEIVEFSASPTEVTYRTEGNVTLSWRVHNPVSLALRDENDISFPLSAENLSAGRYEIPITNLEWGERSYQLTVVGDDNIRRSQSVMITVNSFRCTVDPADAEAFNRPNPLSRPAPAFESFEMVILGRTEDEAWLWVGYNNLSAPEWDAEGWIRAELVECPTGTPPFDRYVVVDEIGNLLPLGK